MKKYIKPDVKLLEISDDDIIQTSRVSIGEDKEEGGTIEWPFSLNPNSVSSDSLFRN